ncbi:MAG: ORF6N domain-containing protein, partial [Elusimicrobiota bacterium]
DYAESVTEEATCPRVGGLALGAALGIIRYSSLSGLCRYRHNPDDFIFQLNFEEKNEVVANCDHLQVLKFTRNLPYAFTEHGAIMLASVLNSLIAVQASVQVVRAFVRLREMLVAHKDLARRLDALESRYDAQFKSVFDAIRELMAPPADPPKRIGFRP